MLPGASEEEALDLLKKYFRREKVRLEVIGKGDPKISTLPITQLKIMKEEGGGALRTTVDGHSESILSRASALRRQSGGGCMSVPQDLCAHLILFTTGTQALPSQHMSHQEGGPWLPP